MSRDPFQPPARHAKRSHTVRRILAGLAAGGILAGAALLATQAAHAATRTELGATVTRAAQIATQRITPSPAPMTPAHGSRAADKRVCRALAVFDAAGIPTSRELRNLAAAGTEAARAYRLADGQLIMALVGHKPFYAADTELQRLCGQD
jgi:crotonobetainyl-CoA:carnitine CoA-transferase CaiB-like acyl-CoA transferase